MQKLPQVEEAREIMTVSRDWGVWRWLNEKKRVRAIADKATAAFDEVEATVKDSWPDDLKKAYDELVAESALDGKAESKRAYEKAKADAKHVDAKVKAVAKRVKDADDEGYNRTMDAEDKFAEAERKLSTSMAKEAAQITLDSYDLREKAIRKAETARRELAKAAD